MCCPSSVRRFQQIYQIFVKEIRDKKIIKKKQKKPDFKNYQIKRKKTPGWEADVSLPFLKVHFPKKI